MKMLEIVSKSQKTNIFVLRTERVKKKCCLSNRVGLNGLHRNIPLFSLKIPKTATKKSKFRVLPAGRLMCGSNRWLTIPPRAYHFFRGKIGDIPRVGNKYPVISPRVGNKYPVIAPRVGNKCPVIAPRVGNKYPVISPGLGTEDLWCPNPFPGGGDGQPPIWTTHYIKKWKFSTW